MTHELDNMQKLVLSPALKTRIYGWTINGDDVIVPCKVSFGKFDSQLT
jgi:hypothetical protein